MGKVRLLLKPLDSIVFTELKVFSAVVHISIEMSWSVYGCEVLGRFEIIIEIH